MSIRFGKPKNFNNVVSEIREDDKLFFKIFSRVHNDDEREACKFIRQKYGFGMMDCKMVIHSIKEQLDNNQITNLLKYISEHNPEYAIWK